MDHAIDVLAYVQTDDLAHLLQTFTAGREDIRLRTKIESPTSIDAVRFGPTGPDILFVDIDLSHPDQFDFIIPIIQRIVQRTPVFVSSSKAPMESVRQLLRLGITDFIPQPILKEDFLGALDEVRPKINEARRGGKAREGKTITFIRSCGGVGATTLSIQMADMLLGLRRSGGGRRQAPVGLFDFDIQFGNVALALDVASESDLVEILSAPERLDANFLDSAMSAHRSGLEILACPKSILPMDAMTPELAVELVTAAKHQFGYTVIDMPHSWASWTSAVLSASDMVVLVTELTVTSVTRARHLLDLMEELELAEIPLMVVANRVRDGSTAGERLKGAETALSRKIDYRIRYDQKTADEARDRGVFLRDVSSKSVIIRDMRSLVENMVKTLTPEMMPSRPQKKSKLKFGFVGKRKRA